MSRPHKDDVERLSRGAPTRAKIGNRRIGHRLTQKERQLFEAAKRRRFLKIPITGIRPNVLNVYRLWCEAEGCDFIIKGGPSCRPIEAA
jgi:hypothetical protein